MKKTIFMIAACLIAVTSIFPNKCQTASDTSENKYDFNSVEESKEPDVSDKSPAVSTELNELQKKEEIRMNIEVNGKILSATLYDNPTAKAFAEKLPMTLPMLDLYGREMCYRFESELPTDNVQYTGYEVGEIVYWPPRHSFVIMYAQNGEEFDMQKVGRIDSGVEIFDGIGNVDVSFSMSEQK